MKSVIISDTHCQLNKVKLPEGDLLIHAGDATNTGSLKQIVEFNAHLGLIKDKYKHGVIFSPGNHDWLFQTDANLVKSLMTNATVLMDENIVVEGLTIHCSPWQPEFCSWAFNLPRGTELAQKWALIPDNADIVVTHGPVAGILDLCPDGSKVGCKDLFDRIMKVKPQLHICGHIHHSYGMQHFNGITFINASICTERYLPLNAPIVIDL